VKSIELNEKEVIKAMKEKEESLEQIHYLKIQYKSKLFIEN